MEIERRQQTPHAPIRWRARYWGPDGKERSKTFKRKADAEKWYAAQTVDVATGAWSDPARGRITVRVWSDRWISGSPQLKPKTITGYRSLVDNHILPSVGEVQIARLDRTAVSALIRGMTADGRGASTIRNAVRVLSAVCGFAIDAGAIKYNPCDRVALPRSRRRDITPLTAAEVEHLADTIDPRFRTLVIFAAYTGLRAGEIGALRVGRIDLLRGRTDVVESVAEVGGDLIAAPTKTHQSRSVALPGFPRDLLAEHIAGRADDPEAFVFLAPDGGQLRHQNFMARFFRPAVRAAGLDGLRFHDLRHTCAALLIAQGAHPRAIADRLGHSTVSVTMDVYGHLLPSLDEALTEGLDRTWSENRAAYSRPTGDIVDFRTTRTG